TFDARDAADLAALAAAEQAGPFVAEARNTPDGRLARSIRPGPVGAGAEIELLPDGALRERFADAATRLYLFGAGHVGRALVLALAPLPFRTRWIDSRRAAFPERAPANVAMVHSQEPAQELAAAPDGAQVLVMTHSHPLDLEIVTEALARQRFSFVGLIGSATKRARFVGQMRAAGLSEEALARLVCPIGLLGVRGKEPAVIAAAVAAQLLIARG
ncbi:MAG: xanthine dehydrogenase accessory protein XdhC, partial [Roseiarcus sp.]